jgi:hypothetical protein
MDMLKITKHLNWYQYSDKLVIRNLSSSEIYSLTDSMKDIWLMVSRGYSIESIYQAISETYKMPVSNCKSDIDDVIYVLKDMNLIYTSSHTFDKE